MKKKILLIVIGAITLSGCFDIEPAEPEIQQPYCVEHWQDDFCGEYANED